MRRRLYRLVLDIAPLVLAALIVLDVLLVLGVRP
jgi:hypothetical protein